MRSKTITCCLALLCVQFLLHLSAYSQDWTEVAIGLPTPDAFSDDRFGEAMAAHGNTVVIGAFLSDLNGENSGVAYVFEYDNNVWTQVATLSPSDGMQYDNFGESVGINADIIVIGSPDASDNGISSGKVYVFEKPVTGWTDMTESSVVIPADNEERDTFGASLTVSDDAIFVGATRASSSVADAGAVYVFERMDTSWDNIIQTARLTESSPTVLNSTGGFGTSLAYKNDILAVGSPFTEGTFLDQGAIYIFVRPGTGWEDGTEDAKLTSSIAGNNNELGKNVAFGDDYLVSSGRYLGEFNDGTVIENGGAVFAIQSEPWADANEIAHLTPDISVPTTFDFLPTFITADQDKVFLGAPFSDERDGQVYIFQKPVTGWEDVTNTGTLQSATSDTDELGNALLVTQGMLLIGESQNNKVKTIGISSITLPQDIVDGEISPVFNTAANDQMGNSVAISENVVVVGAKEDHEIDRRAGAAYVFVKQGDTWTKAAKLTPSDGKKFDLFGSSVTVYGNTIVVSAPGTDNASNNSEGAVYIFKKPAPGWSDMTETSKIINPITDNEHDFGRSVDLHREELIVGTLGSNRIPDVGRVFIFDISETNNEILLGELIVDDATTSYPNWYGSSVSINASSAAVQAGREGEAYVFDRPVGGWESLTQTAKLTSLPTDHFYTSEFDQAIDVTEEAVFSGYYRIVKRGFQPSKVSGFLQQGGWVDKEEEFVLSSSGDTAGQSFAIGIASSGDYLISGNAGPSNSEVIDGELYVFKRPESGWSGDQFETTVLTGSSTELGAEFGFSSGIYRNTIVVGARKDDNEVGVNAGAVYFFEKDQPIIDRVSGSNDPIAAIGDIIDLSIEFNENVVVAGSPFLNLKLSNRIATAAFNGTSDNIIHLRYVVEEGDETPLLSYVSEDSFYPNGNITDGSGTAVNRVLPLIGVGNSFIDLNPVLIDGVRPGIIIETDNLFINSDDPFLVTVSFEEEIFGFSENEIEVENANIQSLTEDNNVYTIELVPVNEGEIRVSIAADALQDMAGNGNAETALSIEYDITPPEAIFSTDFGLFINEVFDVNIEFTEEITSFGFEDLTIVNGSISRFQITESGASFRVNPFNEGLVTIEIPADSYVDLADNNNLADSFLVTFDETPPQIVKITTSVNDVTNRSPFNVELTLSEEVVDLDATDIIVSNGSTSNFTQLDALTYAFDIFPFVSGFVSIQFISGSFSDLAGNDNYSNGFTITRYDINRPVAQFRTIETDTDGNITIEILFSELIGGFELEDIRAVNFDITSFEVVFEGLSYIIIGNIPSDGFSAVTLFEDAVTDSAGNPNSTAESVILVTGGIDDASAGRYRIYPNPAIDVLSVEPPQGQPQDQESKYLIYDIRGNLVLQGRLSDAINGIDVSLLFRGVYLLQIQAGNYLQMDRLILK